MQSVYSEILRKVRVVKKPLPDTGRLETQELMLELVPGPNSQERRISLLFLLYLDFQLNG